MLGRLAPLCRVLIKRSVSLSGHRTSVALEPAFWAVLDAAALRQGLSLAALVMRIDAERAPPQSLASALRLAALQSCGEGGSGPPDPCNRNANKHVGR